ncbi:MAG: bifunctional methylenetetrahydrofolate dehydrogenase/methenyltetrahydrofolate cyclohydrolase FolD [Pseudomonadota bacterium]
MTTARIIDGKAIAARITDAAATYSAALAKRIDAPPCLAVVLAGDDPASAVYVRNKGKMAEKIGFRSIQKTLPADVPEETLIATVTALNEDPGVHGILVQLPLPAHIDEAKILHLIDPAKDVDGFHPINAGLLAAGDIARALTPCTPAGSVILAKSALGPKLDGLHAVIIGRSNIVGKPAAQLLLAENCTVTIAHSRTRDLPALAREADILVAAVGRPEMVKADWVKPGATVIDVGINRVPAPEKGDGKTKLVGDVDYDGAAQIAGAITPVPGGVGPMTIAMLMVNTLIAAARQNGEAKTGVDDIIGAAV